MLDLQNICLTMLLAVSPASVWKVIGFFLIGVDSGDGPEVFLEGFGIDGGDPGNPGVEDN